MKLRNLWTNLRNRGFKDILNPTKWLAFSQGEVIKSAGVVLKADEVQSYCEQVVFRSYLCRDCKEAGKCHDCGCEMPLGMHTKDNFCSMGNWFEMLSPEDWEQYKLDNNISLEVTF